MLSRTNYDTIRIKSDEVAYDHILHVAEERLKRRMSRPQLAREIGVSSAVIWRTEKKPEETTYRTYEILRRYFGWEQFVPDRKLTIVQGQQCIIPFDSETKKNTPPVESTPIVNPSEQGYCVHYRACNNMRVRCGKSIALSCDGCPLYVSQDILTKELARLTYIRGLIAHGKEDSHSKEAEAK